MVRALFVMEQHLGHQTYYENLRRFTEADDRVQARWAPVTYRDPEALWSRVPGLPPHLRGSLTGWAQVRRALAEKSDVIFFNTQVPAVLGGAAIGQRPYVIATDLTPIQYDQMGRQYGHSPDKSALLRSYKHHANVRTLCNAARLLPWSNWARNSLIRDYGVEAERVEVVPPGVDTFSWRPGEGRSAGVTRILFVGGDLERKGGGVLLEAFRSLPRGVAELHLVTRSRTPRDEGIYSYHHMQPNSPELVALFQSCDIFVLPTEAEAFGIAAVEASATGLPIIATDVGGLTDIVAEGETGFLIRPGSVRELVDRLLVLCQDAQLRERMGRAGRQRAEALFDARQNARRVAACLQDAEMMKRRKTRLANVRS
jgi:glycosyltransferase involved in cell wall biosynthesis